VKGKRFSDDCSGLVRAVYGTIGVDPLQEAQAGDNGVTALWRFASAHGRHYEGGRPVEGDLVFFRDTADTNRDGADDDGLTHVGLVDGVEADGTVTVIHRVASGVVRYRMNLGTPRQATAADGHTLNDWLRPPGPGHHPRLTAELFAGYATLLPIEPRLAGR
jgi:cell wall-associated NlpC family hydrolase